MRRLLALLLPLLLLVTACSRGSSDPAASGDAAISIPPANAEVLASVKVKDEGEGKAPTVTFDKPLAIEAESMALVSDGTGEQIREGQIVEFREIALNAESGETLGENFTKEAGGKIVLDETFKQQFPLVFTTFTAAKVGSYIAYGMPGSEAAAATTQAPAEEATPASMSVFQVKSAKDAPPVVEPLAKPEGDPVTPPAGLPTVAEDGQGTPAITIGDAKAPTELVAQDLITGKGDVVAAEDSIVANYVGVNFASGEIFDSSFERGEPATFSLQEVIKGWTQGLAGKTVGSRVLLVIPQALAYGDQGSGDTKGDLVFVVDILGIAAAQ